MIHIKIDNVARYIFDEIGDGSNGHPEVLDMSKYAPVVVLPFDKAGFYFSHKGLHFTLEAQGGILSKKDIAKINASDDLELRHGEHTEGEHITIIYIIAEDGSKRARLICHSYDDGEIKSASCVISDDAYGLVQSKLDISPEALTELALINMFPALVAISFMHCKNVDLIDEPLTRQQRRMKERKGGITYKVLDIEPFKKQVRSETRPGESQLQRALHICRGNFATYTEDNPLFGKLTGTYWRPMHVKGNKSRGEIVKDYDIVINDP
jgi:hypothetical protein